MALSDIFPVLILIAAVAIGVTYMTTALGAIDENTNLTGTEYEDVYNLTIDTGQETINLFAFMPWILILVGIVIALASIYKYIS